MTFKGKTQRGGFGVGMVVGLLVGLVVALIVALYVTKAPVPFVDKVPQRTAEQDAAEVEKNRNWDPNGPLYGKNPARSASGSGTARSSVREPDAATRDRDAQQSPDTPSTPVPDPVPGDTATASVPAPVASAPARSASSVAARAAAAAARASAAAARAAAASATSAKAGGDPFVYFVQVGAYTSSDDAEQQRAKLAMSGMTARITEREQAGRVMYRVRLGPFDARDDAEHVRDRTSSSGYAEAALVRVPR